MIILERIFSDEKDLDKHLVSLKDVNSHRGLGRSALIGGITGHKNGSTLGGASIGALSAYAGKKYANKLDEKGASDEKIKSRSALVGGATGLAAGTGAGVISSGALNKGISHAFKGGGLKNAMPTIAASAIGHAAAGYLGARKNASARLKKRAKEEDRAIQRRLANSLDQGYNNN